MTRWLKRSAFGLRRARSPHCLGIHVNAFGPSSGSRRDNRTPLSKFSLHAAGLARTLTQIHLALTSGKFAEELSDPLYFLFLEYGFHDAFLLSLHEPESPWRQALSSRVARIVSAKIEGYVRLRSHFWMRERRVSSGDFDFVPFSYSALSSYLVPTLEAVWELEEVVAQLLALGSVVDVKRESA